MEKQCLTAKPISQFTYTHAHVECNKERFCCHNAISFAIFFSFSCDLDLAHHDLNT